MMCEIALPFLTWDAGKLKTNLQNIHRSLAADVVEPLDREPRPCGDTVLIEARKLMYRIQYAIEQAAKIETELRAGMPVSVRPD